MYLHLKASGFEMFKESAPSRLIFLVAFLNAENTTKAVLIDANRHQHGNIFNLASPATFEDNAIEVNIRIIAFDGAATPGLDMFVDLFVEVADRARANARAPKRLGDILNSTD